MPFLGLPKKDMSSYSKGPIANPCSYTSAKSYSRECKLALTS